MSDYHPFPAVIKYQHRLNAPARMVFHTHLVYELYYFHEGRCSFLVGDQIFNLEPGNLILLDGMTQHCVNYDPAQSYVRSILHFDPFYLKQLLIPLGMLQVLDPFQQSGYCIIRLRGEQRQEFEELLKRMDHYYQAQSTWNFHRFLLDFIHTLLFILQQFQESGKETASQTNSYERNVKKIMQFIEAHYMEELHMDRLESSLFLSKSYCSRIFKKVTGVTIFEYVNQRRINQAKILFIADPHRSVTDICFELGFKQLSHFCRLFKLLVGCTPEDFRSMYRVRIEEDTSPHRQDLKYNFLTHFHN